MDAPEDFMEKRSSIDGHDKWFYKDWWQTARYQAVYLSQLNYHSGGVFEGEVLCFDHKRQKERISKSNPWRGRVLSL